MDNTQITKSENQISVIEEDKKIFGELTSSDIKNSNISASNKEIILSHYNELTIRMLDANFAGEKLKVAINLTIFESGYKTENISQLILMVIKDIFSDFGNMTISDVVLAFRKGVRGDLGEFMGLNVRTFYNWLKSYNETVKAEAMKALRTIKKQEPPVSEEKKKQLRMDWLNNHIIDFELHKQGLQIKTYDIRNIFYEYCLKNGIGYLTKDEKKDIRETAKQLLKSSFLPSNARDRSEQKEFSQIMNALINDEQDTTVEQRIVMQSKRLAIPIIFNKLIEQGLDLKLLIEKIEGSV